MITRALLLVLFALALPRVAHAVVFGATTEFFFTVPSTTNTPIAGLTLSNMVVKVQCGQSASVTIDESGDTLTEITPGRYRLTTNDFAASPPAVGDECRVWAEGEGNYAGWVANTPLRVPSERALVAGREDVSVGDYATGLDPVGTTGNPTLDPAEIAGTITGTVVSSADCTNSATTFDTTLATAYAGTNGPREAGLRFTSGALVNEVRRIGGYNTNGCTSVNQAFSGTPAAGDAFVVVNQ